MIKSPLHTQPCALLCRLLALSLLATFASISARAQDPQAANIAAYETLLRTSVDAAEKACISNTSSQQSKSLLLSWHSIVNRISSTVSLDQKTEQIRGASRDLPASAQLIENDSIRNCINDKIKPIFALAVQVFQPASGNTAWPNPIDFRFNFIRGPSRNTQMYTEVLRADLQTHAGPVQDRLIVQDPQGSAYFNLRLGYPLPGETISGIITAERFANAHLTTTRAIITNVCFQRPSQFPNGQSAKFDFFDCQEGKACRPSQRATGWLNPCNPPHAEHRGWLEPLLGGVVRAEARDQADAASAETPFWSVPSLTALTQRGVEGVGYTVFTIQTDAFRQSEITGVEVDLSVDGIAINEDGLPPELRPVANDSRNPFVSRFALQTLDFEGAQGGCDRIELALRPVMASGRKGKPLTSSLGYVALRDVVPRVQPLGDATLQWNAAYITPQREWRNLAEVGSYSYTPGDPASMQRMVQRIEEDKRWLDKQGWTFHGKRIVGVIRPPRIVQAGHPPAFGLAAGLIQENGQVRFTFSDSDARQLAVFMIAQRRRGADAARVIYPKPYIFQAVGGSHTAPGICER